MNRILFSAGEASGDAFAAAILAKLDRTNLEIEAIGGARLRALGAKMLDDSSRYGAVSFVEACRVAPIVYRSLLKAKKALAWGKPGLFIPVDFGFINIKLAAYAKSLGWKVLYFGPPGSWRKDRQGADLPKSTDEIVTQFEWSAEMLNKMGASAHWFGHPILEMVSESPDQVRGDTIALLPGSRIHEIERNLGVMAECTAERPVEIALASTISADEVQKLWKGGPAKFTANDTYGVLKRARAALICSGTATLEAALCGCPCIVMYRTSKLMELEFRIRKPKFDYISQPNILLSRPLLPELIQYDAVPKKIVPLLEEIYEDRPARAEQLAGYAEIRGLLGGDQAITETARLVHRMMESAKQG